MFVRNHVRDIELLKIQHFYINDLSAEGKLLEVHPMYDAGRVHVLLKLMKVSKSLQDAILTFIVRKNMVDDLIKMMSPKLV